jgi:hypothetical protein
VAFAFTTRRKETSDTQSDTGAVNWVEGRFALTRVESISETVRNTLFSLTADRSTTELLWIVVPPELRARISRRAVRAASELVAGAAPPWRGAAISSVLTLSSDKNHSLVFGVLVHVRASTTPSASLCQTRRHGPLLQVERVTPALCCSTRAGTFPLNPM